MSNILESLKEHIGPELLNEAAKIYGESEIGIHKTISSLAPAILAGLLEKCGDSHALDHIFGTLSNYNPAILDNLGSLIGGDDLTHNTPIKISAQLLDTIFGVKVPAITNAVAAFSGVKQSSARSLFGLAGPLVMALLSKKINTEGLNASKLVGYLLSERNHIISLLPAGVGSLLGMANTGSWNYAGQERAIVGMGWVWPLLLLLALGIAIMYFLT